MNKKRYWLFCYDNYCPGGGLNDVVLKTDNLDEIETYLKDLWSPIKEYSITRRTTQKKRKCDVITTYREVPGPDHYDILDLDLGEEIHPFTKPNSSPSEIINYLNEK